MRQLLRPARQLLWVALSAVIVVGSLGLVAPQATAAGTLKAAPTLTMTSRSRSAFALSWSAVAGADKYTVRYSTSSKMKSPKSTTVSTTTAEISGLKNHKAYYLQVRATDASGTALTSYSKAKKLWTLPKSGFSVLPPAGLTAAAVGSTSLKVSFQARSGASKYLVRYSTDPKFKTTDRQTVSSTSFVLPGLKSSTNYYLDVRALNSAGKALSYYSDNFTKAPPKVTTGAAYASSVTPRSKQSESLRVASYNIKCAGCETGKNEDLSWNVRRQAVASTIDRQRPDVIGLQEASQANLKDSTLSQYDDLQELLGDPYRLANAYRYNCATSTSSSSCSYVNRGASQSVRILYNAETLELLGSGSKLLAKVTSKDNERYLAWAKLRQISTGKEFYFGTTHLQPNPGGATDSYNKAYYDIRKKQADEIVKELNRLNTAGLPVVVTGDMNTRWNSPGPGGSISNPQYSVFTAAGYRDPLNGGTETDRAKGPVPSLNRLVDVQYNSCNAYNRQTPPLSTPRGNNIDYIYLKGGIEATAWATVLQLDENNELKGVIPSDHNLIQTDLSLG